MIFAGAYNYIAARALVARARHAARETGPPFRGGSGKDDEHEYGLNGQVSGSVFPEERLEDARVEFRVEFVKGVGVNVLLVLRRELFVRVVLEVAAEDVQVGADGARRGAVRARGERVDVVVLVADAQDRRHVLFKEEGARGSLRARNLKRDFPLTHARAHTRARTHTRDFVPNNTARAKAPRFLALRARAPPRIRRKHTRTKQERKRSGAGFW